MEWKQAMAITVASVVLSAMPIVSNCASPQAPAHEKSLASGAEGTKSSAVLQECNIRSGKVDVSKWRGFNLPGKYYGLEDAQKVEDDFRMISELGFNFVRLCLDYRRYVAKDDWLAFNETALKEIDNAVGCAAKYKIHLCLDLHQAPGFGIGIPRTICTDPRAQEAFIAHWTMFAKRYKEIPVENLSFNLVNEPVGGTAEQWLGIFTRAIEAVHVQSPGRIIVVDGFACAKGRIPFPELATMPNVVQAARGYCPIALTHYKMTWDWTGNVDKWAVPTWPLIPGMFYGPRGKELAPLVLNGEVKEGAEISLHVYQVSGKALLVAKADGRKIWEKVFEPGAGDGEWKKVVLRKDATGYDNIYDKEYSFKIPHNASKLAIENVEGNWLSFSGVSIRTPDGKKFRIAADATWLDQKLPELRLSAEGGLQPLPDFDPGKRLSDEFQPWLDIAANGAPVFIGEFGAYNKTPHDATLAWMKCHLEQWKTAKVGWALWTFRGGFGILDSGRSDVEYEDFNGHKLDKKMLELLRCYLN